MNLAGIFPPLPTPFDARGDIAFDRFEANLARWHTEPLEGYVLGGSNGEYALLTPEERVALVQTARASLPAGRLLIAGSTQESTRGTVTLTRQMAEAGAHAALVTTPNYYRGRMTEAALETFFRTVADEAPIPVILYNVPANTALELPAPVIIRLSTHPNIIGVKDSGGDVTKLGLLAHRCAPGFQILAGSAGFFLAALAVGAVGGVMATANFAARPLAELRRRFLAGDLAGARALQHQLIEVNAAVTARLGVAGLKAALDHLGYYGGPVRAPLLPLNEAERASVTALVDEVVRLEI